MAVRRWRERELISQSSAHKSSCWKIQNLSVMEVFVLTSYIQYLDPHEKTFRKMGESFGQFLALHTGNFSYVHI